MAPAWCPSYSQPDIQERGPWLVTVKVVRATGLPKLPGRRGIGKTDTPDGYVKYTMLIGSIEETGMQTQVIKDKQSPEWNFECSFPVPEADGGFDLLGEVWDYNKDRAHRKLGEFQKHVQWKQSIQSKILLENCSACVSEASVYVDTSWASAAEKIGRAPGEGGSFAWPWLVGGLALLLVCGGVLAAVFVVTSAGVACSSGARRPPLADQRHPGPVCNTEMSAPLGYGAPPPAGQPINFGPPPAANLQMPEDFFPPYEAARPQQHPQMPPLPGMQQGPLGGPSGYQATRY